MKAIASALALLLVSGITFALFLVGPAQIGKPFSILCEGKGAAYISAPDGSTRQLALDGGSQAQFTPEGTGPYTVQCGNETKTVFVQQAAAEAGTARDGGLVPLAALFSVAAFLALMAVASAYVLASVLRGPTRFSKTVSGGRARLLLRAGREMERVRISDPVCFDHTGRGREFSIPALKKGAEWSFEYPIASPEKALPASLSADVGGRRASMLSELYIENAGGTPKPELEKDAGNWAFPVQRCAAGREGRAAKRKLPRASG